MKIGDVIHGFCQGIFGRDHYDCCRVEAMGPDWIVTRKVDGNAVELVQGLRDIEALEKFLEPVREEGWDGPEWCCSVGETVSRT